MLTYNYWNSLRKVSEEVNCIAGPEDYVFQFGGIVFLLQRKNECNNIVCQRVEPSDQSVLTSILQLRLSLIDCGVQFIRVEGNLKRYLFLQKLGKRIGGGCNVILDTQTTKKKKRNIFYIKLF